MHIHTRTHTHVHTQTHTSIHTDTCMNIYACTSAYTDVNATLYHPIYEHVPINNASTINVQMHVNTMCVCMQDGNKFEQKNATSDQQVSQKSLKYSYLTEIFS